MNSRVILHCDMDAFYAAIEQRDRPELRGRPVVVGGLGPRGVVATASYEARRFGVHSAMPMAIARRKCPNAVILPPRMADYLAVTDEVRAVFDSITPLVEPLSLDEAFLDVTGSALELGDGTTIARRIQAEVEARTQLTISIGVASSKFVAKVASDLRKPRGIVVVPPGTEAEFLAPLPLGRLFGAGKVTLAKWERAGLSTIADLLTADRALLDAGVGRESAEHFLTLARGIDPRAVVPDRDPKSIGRETTFDDDLDDPAALDRVLAGLADDVGRRLRAAGCSAQVIRVKLRYPPFETHSAQHRLRAPTDDDLTILHTARALLEQARDNGRPLRLLGVTGADLVPTSDRPRQLDLFETMPRSRQRQRELSSAVDRLRERFGDAIVRRGSAIEPGE
jgi:DNA polymerase-4